VADADARHDHAQWDMQAVPTLRAHAAVTLGLTERVALYAAPRPRR
jgi:hypothetical protein